MKHFHVYLPKWDNDSLFRALGCAPDRYEAARDHEAQPDKDGLLPIRAWTSRNAAATWARRRSRLAITKGCEEVDCRPDGSLPARLTRRGRAV